MHSAGDDTRDFTEAAFSHLWLNFTRHGGYQSAADIPSIVRGDGCYVYDADGRRYLDGLAGLFTCQVGHGRHEIAEAMAAQASTLEFFPLWTYAHPTAAALAERLAGHTPGELNRIFFTSGGSESVEAAWKLCRQYFKLKGMPTKHKVVSRYLAYHGTTMGALSITGIPVSKAPFEPLVPGAVKAPNTNFYRAPAEYADDLVAFGQWAADQIEQAIMFEGPETVAAVFVEPVQNVGGSFPPPPGYLQRVREICDRHNVLMVCDEVITAFGRIGAMFASNRYGVVPDIITFAKGVTSGYIPLGGVIASEAIFEVFKQGDRMFSHGMTYSGHPVACAAALANLDILEGEQLPQHVRAKEQNFASALESLRDISIVGDVRGAGYFWTVELVKDQATRESFSDAECERVLRGFVSPALFEGGLYCRTDDRGDPVLQFALPLIADQAEFDLAASILRDVLGRAAKMLQ